MIYDLTMPIDARTPIFPGDTPAEVRTVATVEQGGYGKKRLGFDSHFSTHIDAPIHMIAGGKTLSAYPIEKFVGTAVVIDVRGKMEIEADLSSVQKGDIVFFLTEHSKKAYDSHYFENNPVITEKTAQALIDKEISIVGLDSFTPDNEPYTIHKMFLEKDILIVENLVDLEPLLGKRFQCVILPLKVTDGDGAPCRVIGILE